MTNLIGECQDSVEDMTVERETKDLSPSDLNEQADAASGDIDQSAEPRTPFTTTESLMEENRPSSSSPRTLSPSSDPEIHERNSPSVQSDVQSGVNSPSEPDDSSIVPATAVAAIPKLRLNALLASDPALNPDAKNLKILHEETTKNQQHDEAIAAATAKALTSGNVETKVIVKNQATPSVVENAQRVKVFMCLPCGIGFSSRSTLEAHQAYYCSHRKEIEEDPAGGGGSAVAGSISSGDKNSTITSGEPSTKSIKTGKQYACTQCSYSADKKVSLNRHMRMHQSSPAPSSNASNGGDDSSSQQIDRYCSECDIKFSNVKTYRAHKQHYCNSRRNDGQTTPKLPEPSIKPSAESVSPPQPRTKTPTPAAVVAAAAAAAAAVSPQSFFIALPTNPMLIIPYYLIPEARMIAWPLRSVSSAIPNPESTCFSLENGSLKPLATALSTSSIMNNQISQVDTTPRTHGPPSSNLSNSDVSSAAPLLTEKNVRSGSANSFSEPKQNKKDPSARDFVPLDLSLRRSPIQRTHRVRSSSSFMAPIDDRIDIETMMEGKENLSIDSGSITPEQIVCAPSLPNSPSMSPSPKRRALSPRSSSAASISPVPPSVMDHLPLRTILSADIAMKLTESNIIPPLIAKQNLELAFKLSSASAVAAAAAASATSKQTESNKTSMSNPLMNLPGAPISVGAASTGQPQIFVKQGVSKCKECNIVFCKYENYLAHKQHYCSARNQEDSENKISTPPTVSNSGVETNQIAYQQLICAACGIKYTSLDNLRAHQKFYCPKGGGESSTTTPVTKEKCSKCKHLHEIGQPCPPPVAPPQQCSYKCPVCDVVSQTATESRKHLETHGSVKAFRCSICRYKGNTLRGMRTHIRMHFDKKTSDFNEENYMSCILEDDGLEIPSPVSLSQEQLSQFAAVAQQQHQQQQLLQQQSSVQQQQQHSPQNSQQIFNCEICNYSSSYKGNVMRHMKLVHSQPGTSPSISPEVVMDEGDASIHSVNGDNGTLPESFTIKTEPLETTAISVTKINNNSNANHHQHLEPLAQIKSEPIEITDGAIRSLPSPISIPPPLLNSSSPLSGDENSLLRNSTSIGSVGLHLNQKYCQTCDITFNYTKTYLAHKQFYCKNKPHVDSNSPSPVPPVQSPTMLNKNKENLEATIL